MFTALDLAFYFRVNFQLDSQESSLLWKFRYSLLSNPKALPKFVLAVDWTDESESSLATGTELGSCYYVVQWIPYTGPPSILFVSQN